MAVYSLAESAKLVYYIVFSILMKNTFYEVTSSDFQKSKYSTYQECKKSNYGTHTCSVILEIQRISQ